MTQHSHHPIGSGQSSAETRHRRPSADSTHINGKASASRLQLLVFIFVIALCFIVNRGPDGFPDVPPTVLALLGISATSYTVAKAAGGDLSEATTSLGR